MSTIHTLHTRCSDGPPAAAEHPVVHMRTDVVSAEDDLEPDLLSDSSSDDGGGGDVSTRFRMIGN